MSFSLFRSLASCRWTWRTNRVDIIRIVSRAISANHQHALADEESMNVETYKPNFSSFEDIVQISSHESSGILSQKFKMGARMRLQCATYSRFEARLSPKLQRYFRSFRGPLIDGASRICIPYILIPETCGKGVMNTWCNPFYKYVFKYFPRENLWNTWWFLKSWYSSGGWVARPWFLVSKTSETWCVPPPPDGTSDWFLQTFNGMLRFHTTKFRGWSLILYRSCIKTTLW